MFESAWADWMDEYGPGTTAGVDVTDEVPENTDPPAVWAAMGLCDALEKQHGMHLADIFTKAVKMSGSDGDRQKTPEVFGHYAAMGFMGHGVSLHDVLGSRAARWVKVPRGEFTCFDLSDERFPIPPLMDTRTPEQKARDAEIVALLGT